MRVQVPCCVWACSSPFRRPRRPWRLFLRNMRENTILSLVSHLPGTTNKALRRLEYQGVGGASRGLFASARDSRIKLEGTPRKGRGRAFSASTG
jgi:hypothetical protein